jgi:transposase
MAYYVGVDWGGTAHAVGVVDEAGRGVARFTVAHDADGLAELVARLARLAPAAEMPVAIERPSGLLVEALIDAGHPVVPIHPNVVKACRPRYRAAGGKSDPGDGDMLADILRTDGHRFARLRPCSDEVKALRALVRTRDDLVASRVALANQLRALLDGFWPGAAAIFADVDSAIALAFLARYPTPDSAARLGEKRLEAFLAQHRYCGRRSSAELLARLRAAPTGRNGDAEAEIKGELVRALVAVLGPLVGEIARLTARLEHAVADLPDGRIVMSFPRAGRVRAAQILAELGDVRSRFPTQDQLAAEAGVCPVTYQSGKVRSGMLRTGVVFRWACNRRLRAAIAVGRRRRPTADNSRHASAWAADIYRRARARGCDHPHAVRILARLDGAAVQRVRVLGRAWIDGQPYDPQRHGGAEALAQTGSDSVCVFRPSESAACKPN